MKSIIPRDTGIIIGIDALRSKSGGAKAHLIGILSALIPENYNIKQMHVWSYPELLECLPDKSWLIKHCPREEKSGVFSQLLWQRFSLPRLLRESSCDIVLNLDAGTVNSFSPSVTMSRDMLSYEPGEMKRYRYGRSWLRLVALKYVQAMSLKRASSAVFLTKYAADIIQKFSGSLKNVSYIPHGVGRNFLETSHIAVWPEEKKLPISCIYVSNLAPYKHQWVVINALRLLRSQGYEVTLTLVGDNQNKFKSLVDKEMEELDQTWVKMLGHTNSSLLPRLIASSNIFIFASSCENMPNSLVEAMAVGLPIACSDRGPMPEVLSDGGLYFDPEDSISIAGCVERIITEQDTRERIARSAKSLAQRYSWERCCDETFTNVIDTFEKYKVERA